MSANTYAGNPNNFPALIHKVESGDPTTGGTWQVPIVELADRTAYLGDRKELTYVYSVAGTYALNLTTFTRACGVEITVVGGGQAGGKASAVEHGHGGQAGAINSAFLALINESAYSGLPNNYSIIVGAGGAAGTGGVYGNNGEASRIVDASTGTPFLLAQGGGYAGLDTIDFGNGYLIPPAAAAPYRGTANGYVDYTGTKIVDHTVKQGVGRGWAQHCLGIGGLAGTLAPNVTAKGGYGAGAGGGGGVASSGGAGGGSALNGTGGHGGHLYPVTNIALNGTIAAVGSNPNGGRGADGLVIIRVFYR